MTERASSPIRLPKGAETLRWGELYGSSPAFFLAESAAGSEAPFVVVAGSGREAEQYLAELGFFAGAGLDLRSFPDRETLPYDPFSPHPDIVSERLATLAALPGLKRGIVVTTQAALLDRLAPQSFIAAHAFSLAAGERVDCAELRAGCWQVHARYGFMEQPDAALALELCAPDGLQLEPMEVTYFLSREKIVPGLRAKGWALLRDRIFVVMARNAADISDYFNIPSNRVVELGTRIEL